jgi:hypothetical protein
MSIQAPILAAMVTASATLVSKGIEWVGNRDKDSSSKAKQVVNEAYDQLKEKFTDGSVTVLKVLESGENLAVFQIRQKLHPQLVLNEDVARTFDGEFRYRLEYLRHCGAVTLIGGAEYGITSVGQAFLEEARLRRDYYRVLFGA